MNGHINNVTYLAWTLETVPEDVFSRGKLRQVWRCGVGWGKCGGICALGDVQIVDQKHENARQLYALKRSLHHPMCTD